MDDNQENPQPESPAESAQTTPETPAESAQTAPAARTPWRERVLGIKGVAAVALAGLVLGGAGGVVITAATNDDKDHLRDGEHRYGDSRFGNPPAIPENGEMMPPPGMGTPPSTAPEDSATDSSDGSESS